MFCDVEGNSLGSRRSTFESGSHAVISADQTKDKFHTQNGGLKGKVYQSEI